MARDESIAHRARNLLFRFSEETGATSLDEDGRGLIEWLNNRVLKEGLSLVTAKCYRRWLAAYLEDLNHPSAMVVRCWLPPGSREAEIVEDEASVVGTTINLEHTEGNDRYASYVDQAGLKLLMKQLLEQTASGTLRYKGGDNLAAFLVITAMTGLRPMEWTSARLLDSYFDPDQKITLGPVLEVHTLKQSGRRDDNPLKMKRYLLLDEWPDSQIEQLRYFMDEVVMASDFERWYRTSRATLSRAWARIAASGQDEASEHAGLSVTIYTARHIFAEEVRRSLRYTRYELAAMLGHSLLTNQKYYGPRSGAAPRGFDFVLPRPWPGDAEDIMLWDRKVNPMADRLQSDLFSQIDGKESVDAIAGFLAR